MNDAVPATPVLECRVLRKLYREGPRELVVLDGVELGSMPPYQRPRWLHAVEALPRTPTGKLLRRKLRELHLALE